MYQFHYSRKDVDDELGQPLTYNYLKQQSASTDTEVSVVLPATMSEITGSLVGGYYGNSFNIWSPRGE